MVAPSGRYAHRRRSSGNRRRCRGRRPRHLQHRGRRARHRRKLASSWRGSQPPRRIPVWLARFLIGEAGVIMMTATRGASNQKAKWNWVGRRLGNPGETAFAMKSRRTASPRQRRFRQHVGTVAPARPPVGIVEQSRPNAHLSAIRCNSDPASKKAPTPYT